MHLVKRGEEEGDVLFRGLLEGEAVVVLRDGVSSGCMLVSGASRLRRAWMV